MSSPFVSLPPVPAPLPLRVAPASTALAAAGLILNATPVVAVVLPEALPVVFVLAFVGLYLSTVAKRYLTALGRPDAAARIARPTEVWMHAQMRLALLVAPASLLASCG